MSDGREGRCGYEFDPETWEKEHGGKSAIDPEDDADILDDEGVWRCPHGVVDGHDRCVFHLAPDERPGSSDAATEFVEVVEGCRGTPAQFVGGVFPEFDLEAETLAADGTIDLRHARVGVLDWSDTVVEGPLDAKRARFGEEYDRGGEEPKVSFEATEFGAEADFRWAEFGEAADFSDAEFRDEATFSDAEFGAEAAFHRGKFGAKVNFRWAEFGAEVGFPSAEFEGMVDFFRAEFGAEADFGMAVFAAGAYFFEAAFVAEADFFRAEFDEDAGFSGTEFGAEARFRRAVFAAEARFRKAEFVAEVRFREVEFGAEVRFREAEFGAEAHFSEAAFGAQVRFSRAKFWAEVYFILTKFEGRVDFFRAEFGGEAHFPEAEFVAKADFRGSEFSEVVEFGLTGMLPYGPFHRRADFGKATFETPPQFRLFYGTENELETHTATFIDEVSFSGATFREGCDLPDLHAYESPDFSGADLGEPDFRDADLSRAALYGADLSNARLYGALLSDARISDATDFGIRGRERRLLFASPPPDVIYDPRSEPVYETDDGDVSNYTRAAAVYSEIASLADDNAASKLARTCYTWRKDMQRKRYWSSDGEGNEREYLTWFSSAVINAVVRYGESPFRVVSLAGIVVLVFGLLYWGLDLLTATDNAGTPSLVDSLYFSTLTFTTLGLGDFRPVNDLGRALAIMETSAGVVLLALLVFVFSRRATR